MARQPTSMFGHMMQATRQTFLAPLRFLGNASMQAAERLVPHGASELGASLYTGSAYAPPGVTERLTPPDHGNVHGTGPGQAQDYGARLNQQAARMANKPRDEGRER